MRKMNFNSRLFLTLERQPSSCSLSMLRIDETELWKQMKVVLTDFSIVKTENNLYDTLLNNNNSYFTAENIYTVMEIVSNDSTFMSSTNYNAIFFIVFDR